MKSKDILFDEDFCMYNIHIKEQAAPITLVISDALVTSGELLQDEYKEKIAKFLNSSKEWFPIAFGEIKKEVGNAKGLLLMNIYVLFEQKSKQKRIYGTNSLFGLLFNLNADREHGRGMMLDGESFKILKYGHADVAFQGIRGY